MDILPGRRSDHNIISIYLERTDAGKRGRGFWKLNTSLLKDNLYLGKIRACIENCKIKYGDITDSRLLWDVTKGDIRLETIIILSRYQKLKK